MSNNSISPEAQKLLRDLLANPAPMPRSTFDALPPTAKASFLKAGGRLCDNAEPPRAIHDGARRHATVNRAEFFRMSNDAQIAYCNLGLPIRP